MKRLRVAAAAFLPALVLAGCSELQEDLPPTTGPLIVHESGWADTASGNFHGNAIRSDNWDMTPCRTCHGSQYDGGTVDVSCRTCHDVPAGPENCATCHGSPSSPAPPRDLNDNTSRTARGVGAHQKHLLGGSLSNGVVCSDCHNVPPSVYFAGHVDSPQPAEVPMGGFLPQVVTNETTTTDWDPNLPLFTPQPTYSTANTSCSNTYCHGHFKNGNDTLTVVWTDTSTAATACGTCHGDSNPVYSLAQRALPRTTAEGGSHPLDRQTITGAQCIQCHGDVVNANLAIIDKTKHINGRLNVFGEERDF